MSTLVSLLRLDVRLHQPWVTVVGQAMYQHPKRDGYRFSIPFLYVLPLIGIQRQRLKADPDGDKG